MALFTVDPNNIFGKTVDEAGIYNVAVLPSTELVTAKSGKAMVTMNFEVLDGKYAGGEIRYDNIVWDDSTTDKYYQSITRFNTIVVAAGVPAGTQIADLGSFVKGMIGKKLAINTEWEQSNNGKYYLRVAGYRAYMRDGSKPNGETRPASDTSSSTGFGANPSTPTNNNVPNGFTKNPAQPQSKIADDQLPF